LQTNVGGRARIGFSSIGLSLIVAEPFHGLRKILQPNIRGRVRVMPLNFQKKKNLKIQCLRICTLYRDPKKKTFNTSDLHTKKK